MSQPTRAMVFAEVALVLTVFAVHGAWPVPDVNEAHYLAKARHFWNPAWLAGDFFLGSADAHRVFYVTFGPLACLLPLPVAAWIGRFLTWGLLAWSWRRLSWALVPRPWLAVLSAGLLVALIDGAAVSGEWLVGGVEAKGFAYVLVFLAIESVIRERWGRAFALLGGATALHVLVGGWTAVAVGGCWLMTADKQATLPRVALGAAIGAVLALPGIVPALLLNREAPAEIVRQANEIYVYERLPHHLVPQAFAADRWLRYFAAVAAWLALCALTPAEAGLRRFRWIVHASLAIAALGLLVAMLQGVDRDLAASLLRFYWFRLADVLLPAGLAVGLTSYVAWSGRLRPAASQFALGFAVALVAAHLFALAIQRRPGTIPRGDAATKVANYEDWRKTCTWIGQNTPVDAVFMIPRGAQTFKWYADRSDVGCWKDVPQDAAGIVAWRQRMQDIYWIGPPQFGQWRSLADATPEELRALGARFGATHLVCDAQPALNLPTLYPPEGGRSVYAVYELSEP
jgi:hypothetical protein